MGGVALVVMLGAVSASATEASGLPDARVYEQVSSLQKNGNEAGVELSGNEVTPNRFAAAAADGDRVVFGIGGPSGETSSGSQIYSVASRNPETGWESANPLPPPDLANVDLAGQLPASLLPSPDLSRFLFAATGPFVSENSFTVLDEDLGLYRTRGNVMQPEWLSRPTVPFSAAKPEPGKTGGVTAELYPVGGSTPDFSTVYFTYFGTLVPEDESRAPLVKCTARCESILGPWGFYEWHEGHEGHEGTLQSAGVLPSTSPFPNKPDPYGAVPAVTGRITGSSGKKNPFPRLLDNEVSEDGSKAFFVSPEPLAAHEAATPTELYVREQTAGGPKTVLVSRDENASPAAAPECVTTPSFATCAETAVTPVPTVYAGESYVYASPDGSRAFFESKDKLATSAPPEPKEPQGSGPWTYEFNLETERVTYLPGVLGPIAATSKEGGQFIFKNTSAKKIELWTGEGTEEVASYTTPTEPEFDGVAAKNGTVFAFDTNAVLDERGGLKLNFNNLSKMAQTYRYDAWTRVLACVSCSPNGTPEEPVKFQGTAFTRMIGEEGARVFFATAAKLLPEDENEVSDVYEWEAEGTGSCPSPAPEGRCLYLISSGTSKDPSFYIASDESGDNVFFSTRDGLPKGRTRDTDESYDVYDARVNGGGFREEPEPPECAAACRTGAAAPALDPPLTTGIGPSGNLPPGSTFVVPSKEAAKPAPKRLTRAQKLAKALAACRKLHNKKRRAACRKQAKHRYGSSPAKHSHQPRRK